MNLWSSDKFRRVAQTGKRKPRYMKNAYSSSEEESETESFSLDEWLQWISGTDGIVEDNNPLEVESDLQR